MRFGLACLLLVGCDKLADLDELDPPPREAGAGSDVITSEDGDDAITCVGHDEDGDGTPDACDTCPIDNAIGDGDGDTDGIGDTCDPHPATGIDSVVFFTPFLNLDNWLR